MKRVLLFLFVSFMASISISAQNFELSLELNQTNQDHSTEQNISKYAFSSTLEYADIAEQSGFNSVLICDSISVGNVILPSDTICFLDTLAFSIDTAFIPTEPEGLNGFVWGVFSANVSNSTDPFNDASFLGAFGGVLAAPIVISAVYDMGLGLPEGTYFITPIVMGGAVDTDGSFPGLDFSAGCVLTGTSLPFTLLASFTPMNVTATIVPETPPGSNGEATANATGGSGDYSYLWSNAETTQTITGLTVGIYTVTVSDNLNECVDDFVLEVMVTDVEPIDPCDSIAIGELVIVDATVCFLDSLQFGMTGETVVPQSTPDINGFVYAVYSSDVTGTTDPFNEPTFLGAFGGILAAPTDINALYDNNIGIPAGTYYVTPLVLGATVDTDGTFTGLDFSNGCIAIGPSTEFTLIEEFQPLSVASSSVDEISPPGNNGEASVTVTAGSGSYTYLWSNGETTSSITGLASGTYTVTITDDSDCVTEVIEEVVLGQILDVNDIEGTKYLDVFPNPASKNATISYAFDQSINLQVSVMNNLGQLVYSNNIEQTSNGNLEIDLNTFSNGVYLVRISDGINHNIRKLVISK